MTQPRRHAVGVAVTVLLVAGLFALLVFLVRGQRGLGYEPAASSATAGASITLGAFPDSMACHGAGGGPHPRWVTYCPSTTIKLPAHRIVTVTIDQYDTATTFHNPFFDQVRGTIGNAMTVNGRPMTRVDLDAAGHTFTIQTPPDVTEDQLFVSVPLLGVSANAPSAVTINGSQYPKPNVIVFRFRTGGPGIYVWHCYIPCGTGLAGEGVGGQNNFGGPMATTGYMAGTVTVT